MFNYGRYGEKSPLTTRLTNAELDALTGAQLVEKLQTLTSFEHTIFYYGETAADDVKGMLDKYHVVPAQLLPIPEERQFVEQETKENKVVFVNFEGMPQAEVLMLSKGTTGFDLDEYIMSQLYNDYFGAGLSSIVFQEIRESQALAYSAYAFDGSPSRQEDAHYVRAFVGTQADKVPTAIPAMMEIIDTMPVAEDLIANAMDAILKKIETERITKTSIYWNYRSAKKRGYERDLREDVYNKFSNVSAENNMLLEEFKQFQQEKISGRNYTYLILGDKSMVDKTYLQSLGDYKEVSIDELYGE